MKCCLLGLMKFFQVMVVVFIFTFITGCAGGTETGNPVPEIPVIEGSGDDDDITGGDCEYIETLGTSQIISIRLAPEESYNCNNIPVEVVFDFTPDDPLMASENDKERFLTVGSGMNPSLEYVLEKGIAVGNVYVSIRKDIVEGTCTPVIFDFLELDLSDYCSSCFGD